MCIASGEKKFRLFLFFIGDCQKLSKTWGYLINLEKCSLDERFAMLSRYVPVLDKWALCDISLHFLHKLEKNAYFCNAFYGYTPNGGLVP